MNNYYMNKFLELCSEGIFENPALMCVKWMGEDEVKAMMKANDIICHNNGSVSLGRGDDNPLGLDRGADGLLLAPEADEGLDHEDDDPLGAKHGPLVMVARSRR